MTLDQQHWQERLEVLADKYGVVGASLAVQHGQACAAVATGVLNRRTAAPVTPRSVFQIGSITKIWTATLVMQLVDEGLLDLDAPVVHYLPAFRVADDVTSRTVTARQLLAHTSGIDGDFFVDTGRADDCVEKYVAAMATLTQVHPQGATMSYCNAGYVVLGRIVEVLRGTSWDTALRQRLLVPLELSSAGTLPEEALLHAAAVGHLVVPGGDGAVVAPQWQLPRSSGPAGLLHMTAQDLLVFARLHLDGGVTVGGARVLSESATLAMQQPEVEVPDLVAPTSHRGLGWNLTKWDDKLVLGHDGATYGQGAFLRVVPEARLSVALLTNGGTQSQYLYEDLYGELYAELASITVPRRPEPREGAVVPAPERFVGRYVREGAEVVVSLGGEGGLELVLMGPPAAGAPPPPPLKLVPYDRDVLLAWSEPHGTWLSFAFFDLDGERYVHCGGRTTCRAAAGS